MARPKNQSNAIYGPFRHGKRFRVILYREGTQTTQSFATENEAKRYIITLKKQEIGYLSIREALTIFEKTQLLINKPVSVAVSINQISNILDLDTPANAYDAGMIEDAYLKRTQQCVPATHRRELAVVKFFFQFLVKRKLLTENPAKDVEPIGKPNRRKPQLTRSEAVTFANFLFKKAKVGSLKALGLLVLFFLALRRGELLALKARNIDFNKDSTLVYIVEGKTENSQRTLRLDSKVAKLLFQSIKKRNLAPEDRVFPYAPQWIHRGCKKFCKEAGVPPVSSHGLRGTLASLTVQAGIDPRIIAQMLGHASFTTTANYYAQYGSLEQSQVNTFSDILEQENRGKKTPNSFTKKAKPA